MKSTYNKPQMHISHFEENVYAADTSEITKTNGVDITANAMNDKNIDRIEKTSLNTFIFTY